MGGGVVDEFDETGLGEAEFQSAEFAGEELDDISSFWWWDEQTVNSVNDAVGAKLKVSAAARDSN